MEVFDRYAGVFTPQDLSEMRARLDREARPGETPLEREARAAAILHEKRMEIAGAQAARKAPHSISGTSPA